MSEGIIIAIIGAVAVVLAAVIGLFAKNKNVHKTIIKQKLNGNNSTQIGIQNNHVKDDKNE